MPETGLHKYYVPELYDIKIYTATVRLDNENILSTIGYKALQFRHYRNNSLFTKFSRLIDVFSFLIKCPKQSAVVFHFPFHARIYSFLQKIVKLKGIKTIAVIIDVEGLRHENPGFLLEECRLLNRFDFIVVHNERMKNKLAEFLPTEKMYTINIFDYPSPVVPLKHSFEKDICFAGNLKKSNFIYHLNKIEGIQFNLYGEGFDDSIPRQGNVVHRGTFEQAELINNLRGSFGLIWDGDNIETCDGNAGNYLRFNNPYKFSLYISAGLPIIAWKESAIAPFIEKNNIGLTIHSLLELEIQLQQLPVNNYAVMQQNVITLSQQTRSGYFLKTVLQKIIDKV